MKVDYIISGAGIAGSTLALELDAKGYMVLLLDDFQPSSSSQVAAGLINPIVPKRVIPAWNAEDIYPSIEGYYDRHAQILGQSFYSALPMYQIHATEQERHLWENQSLKLENAMFLEYNVPVPLSTIQAPHGCTLVHHCGRLNVNGYCNQVKSYFENKGLFVAEKFQFSELQITGAVAQYKQYMATKIVFCEGIGIAENPFFNSLPATQTWGDILHIQCAGLHAEKLLLKQKHWVAHLHGDEYLAGSNFAMHFGDHESQKKDVQDLVAKLQTWLPAFTVLNTKRAARPTVIDRRPLMGQHSILSPLYLYNGLGTRGCSLVTWLTPLFVDYLEGTNKLPAEMDIKRFER